MQSDDSPSATKFLGRSVATVLISLVMLVLSLVFHAILVGSPSTLSSEDGVQGIYAGTSILALGNGEITLNSTHEFTVRQGEELLNATEVNSGNWSRTFEVTNGSLLQLVTVNADTVITTSTTLQISEDLETGWIAALGFFVGVVWTLLFLLVWFVIE